MLTTTKTTSHFNLNVLRSGLAIALGIIAASIYSSPLHAQTRTLKETMLDDIEVGKDEGWNFISEEETISIQNNLKELGDYSILDRNQDSGDLRLVEEDRRWESPNNRPDYTLETDVYDY